MNKRILAVGLVILVVGLFISLAFWPLTGVSGEELAQDRDEDQYSSYGEDDTVKVYGEITGINKTGYPDWMKELGFEDLVTVTLDNEFTLLIEGRSDIDFDVGDHVYGRIILRKAEVFGIDVLEYWELKGDLSNKRILTYGFYAVVIGGVAVSAAGVVKI